MILLIILINFLIFILRDFSEIEHMIMMTTLIH